MAQPADFGAGLPDFTITSRIDAPVETVWAVLDDFGDIQRWNPGVSSSELTSSGPVGEGSTRHCDFSPFGGVNERIDRHVPNERLTVNINETFKLPISDAVADFGLSSDDGGTLLTLHYSYTFNWLGRLTKGLTDRRLREGISGLADSLREESERTAGRSG